MTDDTQHYDRVPSQKVMRCHACGKRGFSEAMELHHCEPPAKPVGPITPAEARQAAKAHIPPEVFQAFNELIARNLRGNRSVVSRDAAIARIMELRPDTDQARIRESGWLNVEAAYRSAGWEVTYDIHNATFVFKAIARTDP